MVEHYAANYTSQIVVTLGPTILVRTSQEVEEEAQTGAFAISLITEGALVMPFMGFPKRGTHRPPGIGEVATFILNAELRKVLRGAKGSALVVD